MLIIAFSHTQGLDCQPSEKHWPTLRQNGSGMGVLIIDGTRVGDVRVYDDEIMQTVIQRWGTGGGNVPYVMPIEQEQPMAYDEYNDSVADTHHVLRAGTKQSTGVIQNAVVRRLTPVECERLQGFPDNWTADQADSHRYKQMGNAVTVNVIQWIGARL